MPVPVVGGAATVGGGLGWGGLFNLADYFTLDIVQEPCASRGGRPGLAVLTSLLVSVDVKLY